MPGRERDDVGDDAHRRLGRVDVGVADHELFEDVVLQGARELLGRDALLLGGDHVHGHDGQRGAVHGHGDGHLVERDAVEEDLHVLDGVDGHASLADVADNARMVGVIASMGSEVERDGEARLARLEVATVEGVGFFGGGEAGVLADGPGTAGVHRGRGPRT